MADVEHEAVEDAVAAEAVVEFVDREHLPHAEIMQTIELCIDLVLVAAVDFRQAAGLLHAAVEQMRNLDAEDDRHLRSEERRVGKECVSKCRARWSAYH